MCEGIIRAAGLPMPFKSRCYCCPHQTQEEWDEVRSDPEDWALAVAVDEEVRANDPEQKGLYLHFGRTPLALVGGATAAFRRRPRRAKPDIAGRETNPAPPGAGRQRAAGSPIPPRDRGDTLPAARGGDWGGRRMTETTTDERTRLDEARALVIEMRQYFYAKGLLTGECVAWNRLKRLCGTDEDWDAENAWAAEYRRKQREGK